MRAIGRAPTPTFERLTASLAGFISFIVLFEVALRIAGHSGGMFRPLAPTERGGLFTVVCIGDSYTFGEGVSQKETYPSQLQDLLNQGAPEPRSRVINLGVGGQNSTSLLERLDSDLEQTHPDVIVLMTGGANLWDYHGYLAWKNGSSGASRVADILLRIKVVRFCHLAYQEGWRRGQPGAPDTRRGPNEASGSKAPDLPQPGQEAACSPTIRDLVRSSRALLAEKRFAEAIDPMEALVASGSECSRVYAFLSTAYMGTGRPDEALEAMRRAIAIRPDRASYHSFQGFLLMSHGQIQDAIQAWVAGLDTPDDRQNAEDRPSIIHHLVDLCGGAPLHGPPGGGSQGAPTCRDQVRAEMERRGHGQPRFDGYLRDFEAGLGSASGVGAWIEDDITRIIEAARARGIPIILMSYPVRQKGIDEDLFEAIARRHGVPFVDNTRAFGILPSQEGYFLMDRHCSAQGNALVAKGAAERIAEIMDRWSAVRGSGAVPGYRE